MIVVSPYVTSIASPERIASALLCVLIASGVGFFLKLGSGNAVPILWQVLDRMIGSMARKSYNTQRSFSSLAFRGGFFVSLYIVFALVLAGGAVQLVGFFPLFGFLEPILLMITLSCGAVWSAMLTLYRALGAEQKLTKGSFYPIAVSTRTDLNSTDHFGITRVGIGFMALTFNLGLVAPLFWYLLFGLPGAYLYAAAAAARWGLAKEGFAKGMGDMALKLEAMLGCIPHLFASFLMVLAALFTPTARLTRAVMGCFSSTGRAPYAQGGAILTAVAWALNISLGGPVQDLDGSVLKRDWVGPKTATAKLDRSHLRRAIYLSVMGTVLTAATLISGLFVWRILTI
jgi:adenosylcobinamide-phosphate synthase